MGGGARQSAGNEVKYPQTWGPPGIQSFLPPSGLREAKTAGPAPGPGRGGPIRARGPYGPSAAPALAGPGLAGPGLRGRRRRRLRCPAPIRRRRSTARRGGEAAGRAGSAPASGLRPPGGGGRREPGPASLGVPGMKQPPQPRGGPLNSRRRRLARSGASP